MSNIPLDDLSDRDLLVLAVTKINDVSEKVCRHDAQINIVELNCQARTAMYDEDKRNRVRQENKNMWTIGIIISLFVGIAAFFKDWFLGR